VLSEEIVVRYRRNLVEMYKMEL